MKVAFKPINFFTKNPSLDVPPSTQAANQSVLVPAKRDFEVLQWNKLENTKPIK